MPAIRFIILFISAILVPVLSYDPKLNTRSNGERALFGQSLTEDVMFCRETLFPYEVPDEEEEDTVVAEPAAAAVKTRPFVKPTFVGGTQD
jgi:hypothetical protein